MNNVPTQCGEMPGNLNFQTPCLQELYQNQLLFYDSMIIVSAIIRI